MGQGAETGKPYEALWEDRPALRPTQPSAPAVPSPAVTDCTSIEGAEFSTCGPPCPRSCDDLVVSLGPLGTPTGPLIPG